MDERTWSVMSTIQQFMEEALAAVRADAQGSGPLLADVLAAHLGADPRTLPVVRLDVPPHQFVNLDVAVAALVEEHAVRYLLGRLPG
jgi:hypothetical protein